MTTASLPKRPRRFAAEAASLDAADGLAPVRDEFIGAETSLVYFDGNSLGRPLRRSAERLHRFVHEQWGGRLIRGWDESWMELPFEIGDSLGRSVIGAAPGQTVIGDSTTVLLYKLIRAAFDAQHAADGARVEIVVDTDNFPTDRYLVEGIAAERGGRVRWIEVDRASGVTADALRDAVGAQTAVVVLSQIAYRSGFLADAAALTRIAHDAGALVLWDLCHSAGSVAIEADAWGFDLAVGCTYKYLNGGPGSPAFAYVARAAPGRARPADPGVDGCCRRVRDGTRIHPGARHATIPVGHPADRGDARAPGHDRADRAGGDARRSARSRSASPSSRSGSPTICSHRSVSRVASPRDAAERGGHVTLQHPAMRAVTARLWTQDVIPDYRDPGGLRIGLSPLSTSYAETLAGMVAVRDAVIAEAGPHGVG